jgi:hypothetical protein
MDPMSATMVKLDGKTGVAPADMSPKPVFWDGLNLLIGFSGRKFSRQELFIPKRMPGSCLKQPLAICQRLGAPVELLPGEKLQSFSRWEWFFSAGPHLAVSIDIFTPACYLQLPVPVS